jgi:ribonuclease G
MQNEENREKILGILREELKKDRTKTNIIGMTGLGLIEMTRKKTRQSLDRSILVDCPNCSGTGKVLSPLFIAGGIEKRIEKIASFRKGSHSLLLNSQIAELFSNELKENISAIEDKWGVKIELKASKEILIDELVILEGKDE